MKKSLLILLLFLPGILSAHEDHFELDTFGLVTTRFMTGGFYEEARNVEFIGQYAEYLCDSLGYEEPVFLDFIHDYGMEYHDSVYCYINFGEDDYSTMWIYQDSLSEATFEHNKRTGIDSIDKIVVRQFGRHFDIEESLNLLYYAISGKGLIAEKTKQDTLRGYFSNMFYLVNSIPQLEIDSIKKTKDGLVKRILNNKISLPVLPDDSQDVNTPDFSYFTQNNEYVLIASYKHFRSQQYHTVFLDTLSEICDFGFNLTKNHNSSSEVFLFTSPLEFKYFQYNLFRDSFTKSILHTLPAEEPPGHYSFFTKKISSDIYIIFYGCCYMYPGFHDMVLYLADDDVLITDFEEYINSHRKKRKE
jgi:hypothetical protein